MVSEAGGDCLREAEKELVFCVWLASCLWGFVGVVEFGFSSSVGSFFHNYFLFFSRVVDV